MTKTEDRSLPGGEPNLEIDSKWGKWQKKYTISIYTSCTNTMAPVQFVLHPAGKFCMLEVPLKVSRYSSLCSKESTSLCSESKTHAAKRLVKSEWIQAWQIKP